jgi:hypothetical protein
VPDGEILEDAGNARDVPVLVAHRLAAGDGIPDAAVGTDNPDVHLEPDAVTLRALFRFKLPLPILRRKQRALLLHRGSSPRGIHAEDREHLRRPYGPAGPYVPDPAPDPRDGLSQPQAPFAGCKELRCFAAPLPKCLVHQQEQGSDDGHGDGGKTGVRDGELVAIVLPIHAQHAKHLGGGRVAESGEAGHEGASSVRIWSGDRRLPRGAHRVDLRRMLIVGIAGARADGIAAGQGVGHEEYLAVALDRQGDHMQIGARCGDQHELLSQHLEIGIAPIRGSEREIPHARRVYGARNDGGFIAELRARLLGSEIAGNLGSHPSARYDHDDPEGKYRCLPG